MTGVMTRVMTRVTAARWLPLVALVASVGTLTSPLLAGQSDRPPVAPVGPVAVVHGARTVAYHPRDLIALHAKLRYTTLIVLPDGDDVVEVTCGDKESWIVNAHGSLVSVKPTQAGRETNLNVLTTSGRVYAFLLTDISDRKREDPDLTVYLEPAEPAGELSASRRVKFVPAEQVEDCRAQADLARDDARRATESARAQLEDGLATFRSTYPLSLAFPYRFKADARPFFVHAIFHDDHATYIQARAPELPAVYELKDGAPNLVNFEVRQGTYVVPKVLESGYLAIGKQTLVFQRVDPR